MPIISHTTAPCFELPGLTVHALASPSRGATETCVWRISLGPGTPGLPHQVTREEIFVITAGTARVTIDGATSDLVAGDALVVPQGVPFCLENVSKKPCEAVVSFPVGGQAVTSEGT